MKLSELLAKPIKVKGGGILNLKGISKHIVDKEIGGGGAEQDDAEVLAKYGCVDVISTEFTPAPVTTYIKMVVGDKNKKVTITPDDFIKYNQEVQNLITAHQESGDLESYIISNDLVPDYNVIVYDLIPKALSDITLNIPVTSATQGSYTYNIPNLTLISYDYESIQTDIVPIGSGLFYPTSLVTLNAVCFIAFDQYFGLEKVLPFGMPALYIDVDATPVEGYLPAKFVWVIFKDRAV